MSQQINIFLIFLCFFVMCIECYIPDEKCPPDHTSSSRGGRVHVDIDMDENCVQSIKEALTKHERLLEDKLIFYTKPLSRDLELLKDNLEQYEQKFDEIHHILNELPEQVRKFGATDDLQEDIKKMKIDLETLVECSDCAVYKLKHASCLPKSQSNLVKHGHQEADGLHYFVHNITVSSFWHAKAVCDSYPGYRLAIIKSTKAKEIALKHCTRCSKSPYTVIDMFKSNTGVLRNGDYSLVTETELYEKQGTKSVVVNQPTFSQEIFVLAHGDLHDENPAQNLLALCQSLPICQD